MPLLKVQLNHPGKEKPFRLGKGYQKVNDIIVREWNDDPRHYRKILKIDGEYISSLDKKPLDGKLLLWGEWEGNSVFTPLNNGKGSPYGIHEPFHSILIRGFENTDPYIYGDCYKYATCKQSGQVANLDTQSLILFGSTFPSLNAFYLDTVFVVKSHEKAIDVFQSSAKNYTITYREETLEELGGDYLGPVPSKIKRIYKGQKWSENPHYFSFVPCKLDPDGDYERFKLDLNDKWFGLSTNPTGKSFLHDCKGSPQETWKRIAEMAIDQGFCLAIKLMEPEKNDILLAGISKRPSESNGSCNDKMKSSTSKVGCK